jgi:hypothetical protein
VRDDKIGTGAQMLHLGKIIYDCEVSQAVPARPFGKERLDKGQPREVEKVKVMASGLPVVMQHREEFGRTPYCTGAELCCEGCTRR